MVGAFFTLIVPKFMTKFALHASPQKEIVETELFPQLTLTTTTTEPKVIIIPVALLSILATKATIISSTLGP